MGNALRRNIGCAVYGKEFYTAFHIIAFFGVFYKNGNEIIMIIVRFFDIIKRYVRITSQSMYKALWSE